LSWEEGTREDSLPQGIGRHGERSGCERRFKGFNEVYSYRADYGRDPHTWCRWREVRLKTSGMKRDTTCRHKMEPVDPSRSFIFSRGRWVVTGGKLRARRRSRAMRHGGSLPAGHRTAQGLWCSVRHSRASADIGGQGLPLAPKTIPHASRGYLRHLARRRGSRGPGDKRARSTPTMTEDGWKTYESLTVQARPGVRRDPVFHVLGRDGLDEGSHLHEGTRRRIDARAKPGDSSGSSSSDSWRSATRFR
jgi:hypothetical protein